VWHGLPLPERYTYQSILFKEMYLRERDRDAEELQFYMKVLMLCTQYTGAKPEIIQEYIGRAEESVIAHVDESVHTTKYKIARYKKRVIELEAEDRDSKRLQRVSTLTV